MILNKIWERYFLSEFIKTFLLFILCFYGIYILIDYTSRIQAFHLLKSHGFELVKYYLLIFDLRIDVLIPFALLIATIRTLCHLNVHNELIALLVCGVKLKTLLRPFLIAGLFFTILTYVNMQMIIPGVIKSIMQMEDSYFDDHKKPIQVDFLHSVLLADNTTLVFQRYNTAKEAFHNVWWLKSADDIYHMEQLASSNDQPVGHYIDHLVRQSQGQLVLKESFTTQPLPGIRFNKDALNDTLVTANELSISQLWHRLPSQISDLSVREAEISATFFHKLIVPWLCLFAVIAPAPFCLRFTRQLPVFFIYSCSIFGLVLFYLGLNAANVVARSQVIAPIWALVVPTSILMAFFIWRYVRLR